MLARLNVNLQSDAHNTKKQQKTTK